MINQGDHMLVLNINTPFKFRGQPLFVLLFWFAGLFFSGCSEEEKPTSPPTVVTGEVSAITSDGATAAGQVTADGNLAVTERGIVLSTQADPTTSDTKVAAGSGVGTYSAALTGLTPGTTYHVRAYAINAKGTAYGLDKIFSSAAVLPTITTTPVSGVTLTSAVTGGDITNDGGSAVTARGVVYGTTSNPTLMDSKTNDGSGPGTFVSSISGLKPSTVYYLRAYATNAAGTAYGPQVILTTLTGLVDVDGNGYTYVVIGTQTWMKENLRVTKYRNGEAIQNGVNLGNWSSLTTGAYAYYNGDVSMEVTYGKLYNWYAAVDSRGLCPTGWHMPSDAEWTTLSDFLGGNEAAGGKMKAEGTNLWQSHVAGVTNESGFTGLPAGSRGCNGAYFNKGTSGYWWTATAINLTEAWSRNLNYDTAPLDKSTLCKQNGFSIRCVKD